ncbi:TatD family [Absidia repens]|uniref:TatD family n=1 Tax=Absidia repens TaxID=90262 RepID=A0A1X2I9D1_9FUNG|nr:TatD family [Absidia repens]
MCGESPTVSIDPLTDDTPIGDFKEEWYPFLCDAHCHAHDDKQRLDEIQQLRTGHITLMGVRQDDWETVEMVAASSNSSSSDNNNNDSTTDVDSHSRCVPCFGIHPWYVYRLAPPQEGDPQANEEGVKHQQQQQEHYQHVLDGPDDTEKQQLISQLAAPIPFSDWYPHLEQQLKRHPHALLGEVGLDRSARLLPGGAIEWHGVKPTNVVCDIDHQCTILRLQLDLALQLDRAVSFHCVQSQGHLMAILQSINQQLGKSKTVTTATATTSVLRVCLHSFGGKPASLDQFFKWRHVKVYVSFSIAINARLGWKKLSQLIQAVPDDQLLIETDLNSPTSLDYNMVCIASLVAQAKNWSLHDTVMKTRQNWIAFTGVE